MTYKLLAHDRRMWPNLVFTFNLHWAPCFIQHCDKLLNNRDKKGKLSWDEINIVQIQSKSIENAVRKGFYNDPNCSFVQKYEGSDFD